jgi:hypothetical protein
MMEDHFPDPSSYSSIARTDCRIACKVLVSNKTKHVEQQGDGVALENLTLPAAEQ